MDPGTQNQYAIYNCDYPVNIGGCTATSTAAFAPVGTAVLGAGRWGQLDLAGEVYEWTLDWYGGYVDPCIDCAYLTGGSTRVIRGGNVGDSTTNLLPPSRTDVPPTERYAGIGFRCARTP
jgi:formylglycine-generating enzyme required for sulfatase activity